MKLSNKQIKEETISLYTDGNCKNNQDKNNNIGGVGIYLEYKGITKKHSEAFINTTNNIMELKAAATGLKLINNKTHLTILYSDSAYVINGLNKKWYKKWKNNGWLTSSGNPVKNREEWIDLIEQVEMFPNLVFKHVLRDGGVKGNEIADELANQSIEKRLNQI